MTGRKRAMREAGGSQGTPCFQAGALDKMKGGHAAAPGRVTSGERKDSHTSIIKVPGN